MRKTLSVAAFILAGCVASPGTVSDVHTGTTAKHSGLQPAASGLLYNLNAAAVIGQRGGVTRYGVATSYSATGLGWANFSQAWSYGQELRYVVNRARVAGCGAGCTIVEEGIIELSREQFERAAANGFQFKLEGQGGSVVGSLPASAFAAALAQ